MIQYSLEGTAYGGDYDQVISAFWATPNRLQDKRLNAVAHELGHSFQLQSIADGEGVAWGGNGFFEMGAQWMLCRSTPTGSMTRPITGMLLKMNTHKAFLHTENIYRFALYTRILERKARFTIYRRIIPARQERRRPGYDL